MSVTHPVLFTVYVPQHLEFILMCLAGLTSFQQSVAIDRLQRILGIIQKPEMG